MTSQRKLHKHIYYCALPGNVSKEIITWHPLNALKQMKTHCNLHSYWKDLQQCTLWSFMLATPYGGYKMQLCLKNWQVQDSKFLHTWDCLADFFLLTQTQVRPSSSMAEQQCGNQEWIFPHPSSPKPTLHPPIPPFRQIVLPRFQRNPREAFLPLYLQDSSQHKSRKWFPGADGSPYLPPHFKIWWLLWALSWRWTVGGTGG